MSYFSILIFDYCQSGPFNIFSFIATNIDCAAEEKHLSGKIEGCQFLQTRPRHEVAISVSSLGGSRPILHLITAQLKPVWDNMWVGQMPFSAWAAKNGSIGLFLGQKWADCGIVAKQCRPTWSWTGGALIGADQKSSPNTDTNTDISTDTNTSTNKNLYKYKYK